MHEQTGRHTECNPIDPPWNCAKLMSVAPSSTVLSGSLSSVVPGRLWTMPPPPPKYHSKPWTTTAVCQIPSMGKPSIGASCVAMPWMETRIRTVKMLRFLYKSSFDWNFLNETKVNLDTYSLLYLYSLDSCIVCFTFLATCVVSTVPDWGRKCRAWPGMASRRLWICMYHVSESFTMTLMRTNDEAKNWLIANVPLSSCFPCCCLECHLVYIFYLRNAIIIFSKPFIT